MLKVIVPMQLENFPIQKAVILMQLEIILMQKVMVLKLVKAMVYGLLMRKVGIPKLVEIMDLMQKVWVLRLVGLLPMLKVELL